MTVAKQVFNSLTEYIQVRKFHAGEGVSQLSVYDGGKPVRHRVLDTAIQTPTCWRMESVGG